LELYHRMELQGLVPDEVTLMAVLVACSNSGTMKRVGDYVISFGERGIYPGVEQFCCIADGFAKMGLLDKAEDLIDAMPFEPFPGAYTSLISSCKMHGEHERGARAMEKLASLEACSSSGPYVLLADIFRS
ncbi:hypothetical protein SELMODRAFT_27680, partial [Selaginella moellendorffii]